MANPYGIEQVDIPSLLGLHQQMKRQRIADLVTARELQIKEKQLDREERKTATLARIFAKGGDQASGGTGAVTQPPASAAPASSVQSEPTPVTRSVADNLTPEQDAAIRQGLGDERYQEWKARNGAPPASEPAAVEPHPLDHHEIGQPLPPRTDGLSINMDALRDLYAIDPQGAAQIQKLVYDSNKQQLEQATARGEAMAVAAAALRAMPEGQRQAEFQRNWAPYLIERGWNADLLRQADLSDDGLKRYYFQGRTIEKIIDSAKDERDFRLRQENQAADNARADSGLSIRREALQLAREKEGRIAAGAPGGAGNAAGMSTDALLGVALGN